MYLETGKINKLKIRNLARDFLKMFP